MLVPLGWGSFSCVSTGGGRLVVTTIASPFGVRTGKAGVGDGVFGVSPAARFRLVLLWHETMAMRTVSKEVVLLMLIL